MSFSSLIFLGYQDGEYLDYRTQLFEQTLVRQIWDSSLFMDTEGTTITKDQLSELYQVRTAGWADRLNEFPVWNEVVHSEPGVYAVLLWGNDYSKFRQDFEAYLKKIAEFEVGGDDSYYDYYPDLWYVANQIAEVLGGEWQELVSQYKARVRERGLYTDDEVEL